MIVALKRFLTWNKFKSESLERQPFESFEDYRERRRKLNIEKVRTRKGQLVHISKTYRKNWSALKAERGWNVDVENSQGSKMYKTTLIDWLIARAKKGISTNTVKS